MKFLEWIQLGNILKEIEIMLPGSKMKIKTERNEPPLLCIFKEAHGSITQENPFLKVNLGFLTEQDMTGTQKQHRFNVTGIYQYSWKINEYHPNRSAKTGTLELFVITDILYKGDIYKVTTVPTYVKFFFALHGKLKFVDNHKIIL
jgi:hypothetical protein